MNGPTRVSDPFGIAADPRMPFAAGLLDAAEVGRQFERHLPWLSREGGGIQLRAIRVARYKPGRRCLLEFDVEPGGPCAPQGTITLVGKARAKGLDAAGYALQQALWRAGFDAGSGDGVSVPEPIGVVPAFQMWLQRKAPGVDATRLLPEAGGAALAKRIAEAIHKVHLAGIAPRRRHTMADELRILHHRLPLVAGMHPHWAPRLERIQAACDRLGAGVAAPRPPVARRGIHRDFYADHVLVDGRRLYLLDFDLYCEGDPGLDAGNFLGHVTEQSLRTLGDPSALADREEALAERFVDLAGAATRAAVRAYATLTLVRHIFLSTQFPHRQPFTAALLELCEQRLGLAGRNGAVGGVLA